MMGKVTAFSSVIFAAVIGLSGAAFADTAGQVEDTSGGAGSVLVTRDGQTYAILTGDPVFDSDTITTRSGASARLTANGCTVRLGGSEQITVNSNFCDPAAIVDASLPPSAGGTDGFRSGNRVLLAGAAGLGILAALALSGDDDDDPASP